MHLKTAAVAALLGLSSRRINQLVEEGIGVRVDKATIDAAATIQNYIAHISGKAAGVAAQLDLDAERARLAKEQADGQALKNAVTRGELLPADEVEREWSDILRRVRSGMLAVTSRVRQRAGLDGATAEILDREIRDALTALADDKDDPPAGAGESTPATEAPPVHMDGTDDSTTR